MTEDTLARIIAFRDKRGWKRFHNPKDLALCISVEAGELLELYQWVNGKEIETVPLERVCEELADVLIYSAFLADALGLDMDDIVLDKLEKNGRRYPESIAYESKEEYLVLKERARSGEKKV